MTQIALDALNTAENDEFVAALGGIFEHAPWVAEAVADKRPFASLTALHQAMCAAVKNAESGRQLAFIKGHPELAGKAAIAGAITDESKSEQGSAGLDRLSREEFDRFHALNAAYNRKFDFPFIICVRLNDKDSIFREFQRRVENDRAAEFQTALGEIFKITGLRLNQLVDAPDRVAVA